ncbi:hypothetical protein A9Y57_00157 [Streptococcus parauberis]|uniref:Uncharacterized protein n=1 Tax=Streptococcus parauberis TaxID=1348 RepID=A0A854WBB4_9STRE|nr:hypothetical protein [Streptococcus parauberis]PCH13888.1 hypothetical protein A9Y57_00523 [Streptococcus parauberis]PCH14154.1 hypothetical protein A9Y57_00157 [Streptococcus parauberis]
MAITPVKRSGYTKDTPKFYLIDAGAVYKNVKYNTQTKVYEGERLGATADGNKFTIEVNYRTIEIDGVKTKAKGQEILESQNAKLETNVKELTADNIRMAINGTVTDGDGITAPTGSKIISGKGKLDLTDYLENIALVGTLSGTNEPVIVILDNALCTSGLEFETKDNEEAVIPMVFEAHADEDQVDDLSLPARIIFPAVSTGGVV